MRVATNGLNETRPMTRFGVRLHRMMRRFGGPYVHAWATLDSTVRMTAFPLSHRARFLSVSALLPVVLWACSAEAPRADLGPADGRDLPAADTGRVAVGDPAPDFSLDSYDDGVVTLSSFRGQKDVILVFYRGWW